MIEPIMNKAPRIVVARVNTVAPARAPKAVWLLEPPKAAAMSPPLPCWSNTTTRRRRQTIRYTATAKEYNIREKVYLRGSG